jgi:hypothetical protein
MQAPAATLMTTVQVPLTPAALVTVIVYVALVVNGPTGRLPLGTATVPMPPIEAETALDVLQDSVAESPQLKPEDEADRLQLGCPTTVTVVLLDLLGSAFDVAVTVHVPGEAGAVHVPPPVIVPQVALQRRAGSTAPLALAVNVVFVPTVTVGLAGLMPETVTESTLTATCAVTLAPAALVAVRV